MFREVTILCVVLAIVSTQYVASDSVVNLPSDTDYYPASAESTSQENPSSTDLPEKTRVARSPFYGLGGYSGIGYYPRYYRPYYSPYYSGYGYRPYGYSYPILYG